MKTFKGKTLPDIDGLNYCKTNAMYCLNSKCDVDCANCLFSHHHTEIFYEWIHMNLRKNKLERILNQI